MCSVEWIGLAEGGWLCSPVMRASQQDCPEWGDRPGSSLVCLGKVWPGLPPPRRGSAAAAALPAAAEHVQNRSTQACRAFTHPAPPHTPTCTHMQAVAKWVERVAARASELQPAAPTCLCIHAGVVLKGGQTLSADLVLDAMGRLSPLPSWLDRAGWGRPPAQRVDSQLCYASRTVQLPEGGTLLGEHDPSGPGETPVKALIVFGRPYGLRGGSLLPQEGNTASVRGGKEGAGESVCFGWQRWWMGAWEGTGVGGWVFIGRGPVPEHMM